MVQDPADQPDEANRQAGSVLQRKARAGAQTRAAQAMSLPKAMRLTMPKVADAQLDMALAVIGVRMAEVAGDDLAPEIAEGSLMLLLDGTGRRRAAVMLDAAFVGALLQQQTMAKVLPVVDGETRKLTATDAAITAPFVEAFLSGTAQLPEEEDARALLQGYTFGARMEEARLLLLALDAAHYRVAHLTLDIAGGVRQGAMTLVLPVPDTSGSTDAFEDEDPQQPAQKPAVLERSVLALNAELNIALTSLTMPLGEVQSLGVGDVLELGVSAFDQANVLTRDGRKLSRGTLGQIDGMRALQLEHAAQSSRVPRRRASDRAALDLPLVAGDGTGTGAATGGLDDLADPPALALPDAPAGMDDLPALDALPDMPELPDLPDLPDMSDLPGFDDAGGLPRLETG